MKPFTLELRTEFRFYSQLVQLDLNLPYGFDIDGDRELKFDLRLELRYEHLQENPELLKLFRQRSDLSRILERSKSSIDQIISLTKLIGSWEAPKAHSYDRLMFLGNVPYNLHNLEVFLEHFRN